MDIANDNRRRITEALLAELFADASSTFAFVNGVEERADKTIFFQSSEINLSRMLEPLCQDCAGIDYYLGTPCKRASIRD